MTRNKVKLVYSIKSFTGVVHQRNGTSATSISLRCLLVESFILFGWKATVWWIKYLIPATPELFFFLCFVCSLVSVQTTSSTCVFMFVFCCPNPLLSSSLLVQRSVHCVNKPNTPPLSVSLPSFVKFYLWNKSSLTWKQVMSFYNNTTLILTNTYCKLWVKRVHAFACAMSFCSLFVYFPGFQCICMCLLCSAFLYLQVRVLSNRWCRRSEFVAHLLCLCMCFIAIAVHWALGATVDVDI